MGTPVVFGDRVLVATTTTGTGTYQIGSAITGYLDPASAGVASGARVGYVVVDSLTAPTAFEIGEGVYTSGAPGTLTRAQIRRNTGGGTAAVSWGAGTKYLLLAPNAANLAFLETDGTLRAAALATAGDATIGGNAAITGTVSGTWAGGIIPTGKGGTGLATLTSNAVLLGNGTGNLQAVAPSAAGNVLRSDGTTWNSVDPMQAMVLLATMTASASASLDFTNLMGAGSDAYQLVFTDILLATNTAVLYLQVSTDNGASWKTTGYVNNPVYLAAGSPGYTTNTAGIDLKCSVYTQTLPFCGDVKLANANAAGGKLRGWGQSLSDTAGTPVAGIIAGRYDTAGAVNAVRLIASAGVITAGKARLYGLRN